ncbi:hypothetical protein R3P38DRAFT_3224789 [Favolaschia claudopus]|uniref:F-box domain-containing protein n=1 Tax=Favolaschia claudopus TaxID=2862362 RepID=A0AAV9ZVR8_9AGAR
MHQSLPTEMVEAILLEALDPSNPNTTWVDFVDLRRTLCLVCKIWKTLVEGHSTLWSTITIQRFSTPALLRRCMDIYKGTDAVLTIDARARKDTVKDKKLQKVENVHMDRFLAMIGAEVMPSAWKVARVTVKSGGETEIEQVTNLLAQHSWPSLQALALQPSSNMGAAPRVFDLPQTHQITTLHLDTASPRHIPLSVFPSLHDLALRNSDCGHWNGFETILHLLTHIRRLTLDKIKIAGWHSDRVVQMPDTLDTLRFSYESVEGAAVLARLEIGGLETLEIRAYGGRDLRDAVASNPSIFARSRKITVAQRHDSELETREATLAVLHAMHDVVRLDMACFGPPGVAALKEFVSKGGQLEDLEEVKCGGIFNEADMQYIAGGKFGQKFVIMQHGGVVRRGHAK